MISGNSMDKTGTIWAGSYLWRMVCSNGMMGWSRRGGGGRRRHTNNADSVGNFRHVLDDLVGSCVQDKQETIRLMEDSKDQIATDDWLTQMAKRLQMRKWELEALNKKLEFEYPLGTGYLKLNEEFKDTPYTKWDFLIDATAVARINREGEMVGEKERKVNMNRATFIEQEILDCLRG